MCYFAYPVWHRLGDSRLGSFALVVSHLTILVALLIWWLRTETSVTRLSPRWSWKQFGTGGGAVMLLALGGFAAGQWILMRWPILSGGDEPVQVLNHLVEFKGLTESEAGAVVVFLAAAIGLVALGGIVLWRVPGRLNSSRRDEAPSVARSTDHSKAGTTKGRGRGRWLWPALALGVGILLFASYIMEGRLHHEWGGSLRWPPVGTIATVVSHALLGQTELGARLPSLLFFLLTGVYVYRIVAAEADRWLAVATAIFCLSMPIFFELGHLAARESGGAFFLVAGLFYLLRHMRTGNAYDVGMVALSIALGYLERRPAAVLLFIVAVSLIAVRFLAAQRHRLWRGRTAFRLYGGAAVLAVWAVLPWVRITSLHNVRPYQLNMTNWSDWQIVTAYIRSWPETIGWPATILVGVGVVVALIRRSHMDWVALACLTLVYALFTSDDPYWIPHHRFVVPMCPAVALLSIGASGIVKRWGRAGSITTAVIVVVAGLCPLVSWLRSEPFAYARPAGAHGLSTQKYYPFDQLVDSLGAEVIAQDVIAPPVYWQTALRPYLLMRDKGGVREKVPAWVAGPARTTIVLLRRMCDQEQIDYIIVPRVFGRPRLITDLTAKQIEDDDVPGFSVVGSYRRGRLGLTLLRAGPPE